MICDTLIVTKKDFDGVVQVRRHCDYDTLRMFIIEAQENDLVRVLGNSFTLEMISSIDSVDDDLVAKYSTVLDGSTYSNCNSETVRHRGVKRALIHYAYAAYIMDSSYIDSTHGMVQKINQDSIPVPLGELKNLHDRHVRLASNCIQETIDFICNDRDTYTLYKGECDCCQESESRKVRSSSISIIKK